MERTAILVANAHAGTLIEQPLNIAAMLAAPLGAVQKHHVRALRTRIGHALKMLVHVIAEVLDIAGKHLIELVHPLIALRLVGTDKRMHGEDIHLVVVSLVGHGAHAVAQRLVIDDVIAADQTRQVKRLARRIEGNRAHAGILAHRLRRDMLVPRQDDIGPDLVRDHHAIVLAINVHGTLNLVTLPHAAAGIVRRAEHRGMDVVLGEFALHVLKVHAPHALVVELKWAVDNTITRGFDRLGKTNVGGTVDQHRIARLDIRAQRGHDTAQHAVFVTDMFRAQTLDAIAATLPFDDAVKVLRARVKVAKHGMLGTLNDVLLDRGHRGKVHIRHPHGDAVEALVGCVRSHVGDLAPGVNGDGVHAVAVDKRAKVVFHAELPCKVDCFGRRYCPPAWAVLARGLALNLTGADEWLVSLARR